MRNLLFVMLLASLLQSCGEKKPHQGLEGTIWRLNSFAKSPLPDNLFLSLSFGKDGKVSAHGVCNSMSGDYTISHDKVDITNQKTTEIACDGIEWEATYWSWLHNCGQFKLDTVKKTLEIKTEKGYMAFSATTEASLQDYSQKLHDGDIFWKLFKNTEDSKIHIYDAPDGQLNNLDYAYHGDSIPHSLWHFFEEKDARTFKDLGAFALLQLPDNFYIARVSRKNAANSIVLYHRDGNMLKRSETLSWSWNENGKIDDQDAWIQDVNKDGKFDIVLREITMDTAKNILHDKLTALVQGGNATFSPDKKIALKKEDYKSELLR